MRRAKTSQREGACKECCLGPRFQDPCGCASFQICGSLLGPMDLASDSLFGIDGSGFDVSLHSWEACPDITLFWCYCPVPVCGRFLRSWSRKWHHFEFQNPDPEAGPENGTTLGARIRTLFWARVLVSLGQNHYIGKKTISMMHTRAQNRVWILAPRVVPLSGPASGSGFWHSKWCRFPDQFLRKRAPKRYQTIAPSSHQSLNYRSQKGRRLPGPLVQEGCHTHMDPESGV